MDADIDRLIRSRDFKGALHALADAHGTAVGRFCQAILGSPQDGADALQDTFVAALAAMPAYRGDSGVRAWIFGIARHQCADHLRKRGRRRSVWARMFGGGDVTVAPPAAADASDARMMLERALVVLPEPQREAVLLRYQQGMDATEVADVLGISHAAARKRISIGMQALRAAMDTAPMFPRPTPVTRSDAGSTPSGSEVSHDDDQHFDDHALRTTESSPGVRP
ncbi:MAG: sigma-70 family RNA polymerase sigma factor [Myxococcota bacterium]